MNVNRHTIRVAAGMALSGLIAAGALSQAGDPRAAGQPRLVNARLELKAVPSGLATAVRDIVAASRTPGWIGYAVPSVPGEGRGCDVDHYPARVYLEGRPDAWAAEERQRVTLEGSPEIAVLFRAEAGAVQRVRVLSIDCEVDAGGLPVTWLSGVGVAESVEMLRGWVARDAQQGEGPGRSALTALALHEDVSAQRALEVFAAEGQPQRLRKRAVFWLGAARGDAGFEALTRLVASASDPGWRRELVFPISLSHRPEATDLLIRLARQDASVEVRKQAMFWLGQKAGARSVATLKDAVVNDPDTAAKKQAVFGLSRMPKGEGIPALIEVARTNRNPEVRRQAMLWLGRSADPRALDYLEEVLRK